MTDKNHQNSDIRQERNRLEARVADILAEARAQGATAAEAGISAEQGLVVGVRLGDVESVEFTRSGGFGVTVYVGQRKGSASTSDTRPEAIRDTVRAALDIARHTSEDPCAGLADPDQLARDIPDLDLHHPWTLDVDRATALAVACEDAGRALDARIVNSDGPSVSTHEVYRVYGNTHGFLAGYPGTHHSLSCVLIARQNEDMQRDYWYDSARDPARLASAESIGRRAGERTLRRLGAQPMATGSMPVLFAPEVSSSLIGHYLSAIAGGALYRRASFMLDRLGEQVFPDWFSIAEHPRLCGGNGSAAFDSDGLPTSDKHFVRGGRAESWALGLYSARKLGLAPTGNGGGTHNVRVADSGLDFNALLERMDRGVVVTELMGQGLNPVTGDYSRGAAGFRVEGGRIVAPVSGITVAGNLPAMYRGIVAVGNDAEQRGNIHCGSVLIDGMMIAADGE